MRAAQHVERAEEIDVDDGLEAVRRHAKGRGGEIPGGARHQDVDVAKRVVRRFSAAVVRLGIAHVGSVADRFAAEAFEAARGRVDLVLRAAEHGQRGAGLGKRLGDAEVDAAGAAGDEHRTALEIERLHEFLPSASQQAAS